MFETERLLLTEIPFIPLFSYVTKRMVNPRLKGWQSNVMDYHYSKDMYFLKPESQELNEVEVRAEKVEAVASPVEEIPAEQIIPEEPPVDDSFGEVDATSGAAKATSSDPKETEGSNR
jgi:p-aminobenzoyl-glutamate transporter AbgT